MSLNCIFLWFFLFLLFQEIAPQYTGVLHGIIWCYFILVVNFEYCWHVISTFMDAFTFDEIIFLTSYRNIWFTLIIVSYHIFQCHLNCCSCCSLMLDKTSAAFIIICWDLLFVNLEIVNNKLTTNGSYLTWNKIRCALHYLNFKMLFCVNVCNFFFFFIFTFWITGIANTGGTLAAIIGTVGAGFFVELMGSFQGFLLLTALLYFCSAVFYIIFSTGERVNFDEPGKSFIMIYLKLV